MKKEKEMIELKARIESLEEQINQIKETAHTGKIGDGKIFITNIDDVVRIRTGETGEEAI